MYQLFVYRRHQIILIKRGIPALWTIWPRFSKDFLAVGTNKRFFFLVTRVRSACQSAIGSRTDRQKVVTQEAKWRAEKSWKNYIRFIYPRMIRWGCVYSFRKIESWRYTAARIRFMCLTADGANPIRQTFQWIRWHYFMCLIHIDTYIYTYPKI